MIGIATLTVLQVAALGPQQIDRLIDRLEDPKLARKAEARLLLAGKAAVPRLLARLPKADTDAAPHDAVLLMLGRLGPDAAAAVDTLARYVDHVSVDALPALAHAIADLTPFASDEAIVKRVPFAHTMLMLKRRTRDPKLATAIAVQSHRFMARRLVDAAAKLDDLIETVQQNKIFERTAAAEVLARRGPKARAAAESLRAGLERKREKPEGSDWYRRHTKAADLHDAFADRAAEALLRIAPEDPVSTLAWAHEVQHGASAAARRHAARRLAAFGAKAAEAVPELRRVLADKNGDALVAKAVRDALARIER